MPEHAGLLCPFSNDGFATRLNNPRAEEVASLAECGVEHAVTVFYKVVEGCKDLVLLAGIGASQHRDNGKKTTCLQRFFEFVIFFVLHPQRNEGDFCV